MDIGTAAAIKEAGLSGKVFLATSGGGEQKGACDQVKSGAFDLDLSYDVPTQASNMAAIIKWMLSGGFKSGSVKASMYTTLIPITKANASSEGTCSARADHDVSRMEMRLQGVDGRQPRIRTLTDVPFVRRCNGHVFGGH
jgi:ABC-type sugar transport system substrate-binding protein